MPRGCGAMRLSAARAGARGSSRSGARLPCNWRTASRCCGSLASHASKACWSPAQKSRELPHFNVAGTAFLQPGDVIPAIGMEHIHQHGSTEDKSHLIFGQPGFELGDHILSQNVALLNVNLVFIDNARHRLKLQMAISKIKVKVESRDEIGDLANFFNIMTENIRKPMRLL